MLLVIINIVFIDIVFASAVDVINPPYRPIPSIDVELQLPSLSDHIEFKLCTPNDCNKTLEAELESSTDNLVIVIEDIEPLFENGYLAERIGIGSAKMNYKTVLIRWRAFQRDYYSSVSNAHGVANQLADFVIRNLREIHLIGIGIGAHIAGFIGKRCQFGGKIHRITALDPPRIFFEYLYSKDIYRLDRNDATFVDVYHSDYKGKMRVGFIRHIGHLDFYSIGQSYCNSAVEASKEDAYDIWKKPFEKLKYEISNCKHNYAAMHFLQTMFINCSMYAVRNVKDNCTHRNCLPLGFMAREFLTKYQFHSGNYVYNATNCIWGVPNTANEEFKEVYSEFQKTPHKLLDERGWWEWLTDSTESGYGIIYNEIVGWIPDWLNLD